jgi:uncharacterized protein involved in exopolysaccharide biosynthesis
MSQIPEADFLQLLIELWFARVRIFLFLVVGGAIGLALTFFIPPRFQSTALCLFPRESSNEFVSALTGLRGSSSGRDSAVMLMGVPPPSAPTMDYVVSVMKSRTAQLTVIQKLDLMKKWGLSERATIKRLNQRFGVVKNPREGKLNLSFEDNDPELAQQVVESFLEFYDNYASTTNNTAAKRQRAFLESQVVQTGERTEKFYTGLRNYLARYGSEVVEGQPEAQAQILGELYKQKVEAEGKAHAMTTARDRLQSNLERVPSFLEQNNLFSAPVIDPVLEALQSDLAREETELKHLGHTSTELHPGFRIQEGRVNDLKSMLSQKVSGLRSAYGDYLTPELLTADAEAAAAKATLERTDDMVREQENRMKDVLGVQVDYTRMEADYKLERTVHDMLQVELARSRVIEARDAASLEVVDPPEVPKYKAFPSRMMFTAGGILLGFLLACALTALGYFKRVWVDPALNQALEQRTA